MVSVSVLGGGVVGVRIVVVGCCGLGVLCFRVKNLSRVDWVCVVGSNFGDVCVSL